jgi:GH25 family lysozyme M1 (1,4-beta-N-acetylmuramidase)
MLQPRFFDANHDNDLDFDKIATWAWAGVFKANQGLGFTDPTFKARRAAAEARGLLVGAYDFATGDPVSANVDRFWSIVDPGPKTKCILDYEDLKTGAMSGDQAYEWLDRVNQRSGRASTIYGGNRIVEHIDHQSAKWIDMAKVVQLWLCQYKNVQVSTIADLNKHIIVPKPWTTWWGLQYAADGYGPQPRTMPGLERNADLNLFDGTRDQFSAAWPGVTLPPAPLVA